MDRNKSNFKISCHAIKYFLGLPSMVSGEPVWLSWVSRPHVSNEELSGFIVAESENTERKTGNTEVEEGHISCIESDLDRFSLRQDEADSDFSTETEQEREVIESSENE